MAWPQYSPSSTQPTAATLLQQIIQRCDGWLATHPLDVNPPPLPVAPGLPVTERQRWEWIRSSAQMDLTNTAHPLLRDYVDPMGAPEPPHTTLTDPWQDVMDCRGQIVRGTVTMDNLRAAIEFIDHLGGGVPPSGAQASPPPDQPVTGRWPDVGFSAPMITARTYHGAILAYAVGELLRTTLPAARRNALEVLAGEVLMDRANVPHGMLRKFVKPDGTGVGATGLKRAWKHLVDALKVVNALSVSNADLAKARKLVRHEAV